MASGQMDTVLRHIHGLAAARGTEGVSDRELLDRFTARQEEGAFAALLQRHGRMVWGVCRHVLRHEKDAEDVFQTTFLVLVQKAGSIRDGEAIGSWLHGTAYRLALRARRDAATRQAHERRGRCMPREKTLTESALQEALALVYEEVQGLPEKHRAAFVLCCLEGKSLAAAAQQLGWKEGTVSSAVARARKQLRGRLARRGVALSVALYAIPLAQQAGVAAVPRPLLKSTVHAALAYSTGGGPKGTVSAEVATLVRGATKSMSTTRLKTATLFLLVLGVGAAVFGARAHQALAARQADKGQRRGPRPPGEAQRQPAVAPAEGKDAVRVRGRVLGPDGKPYAGAKLYLSSPAPRKPAYPVRATSGEDGRFEFTCTRSDLDKTAPAAPRGASEAGAQVMAVARGYGCDWAAVGKPGKAGGLTLRLVKDVPINGRVLDQDGKPVVGAKVRVQFLRAYPGEDLTEWLAALRKRPPGPLPLPAKGWVGPLPEQPEVATTREDGRFRLTGFGRERGVVLRIEGPAIEHASTAVLTRVGQNKGGAGGPAYATFDYVAAPSRPIRGVVRDKKTGKPLAGVAVSHQYVQFQSGGREGRRFTAHTDKEGRFELHGFRKSPQFFLAVRPADGQVYFAGTFEFADTPGFGPLTADIGLVSGIPLRGRVTDKATGKPVPHAAVKYHALYPNASRRKLAADYKSSHSETVTGQDGTYTLAVFPGPGVLVVDHPKRETYMSALVTSKEIKDLFGGGAGIGHTEEGLLVETSPNAMNYLPQEVHNALVLLDPDEKATSLRRDIVLEQGQTQEGSVVGPDGRRLTGVRIWNTMPLPGEVLQTDTFTVRGLNPRRSRTLLFTHREKGLGGSAVLRGGGKKPLTVKMQRYGEVTGRIVDKDGKPVPGVRMLLRVRGVPVRPPELPGGATDSGGHFRLKGIIPGLKQELLVFGPVPKVVPVVVEPGRTKDLGDVKATGD